MIKISSPTIAQCPLCSKIADQYILIKKAGHVYWDCSQCYVVFLDPQFYLKVELEKAHYICHQNDVYDLRYQNFVSPITDYVLGHFAPNSHGLDFGCGRDPVIQFVLNKKDYKVDLYDLFFANSSERLNSQYDYVSICEVVEHFKNPDKEFKQLKSLVKENGSLIVMTALLKDDMDFANWYYHRDPTHIIFYRLKTLTWLQEKYNFQSLEIVTDRCFVLKN